MAAAEFIFITGRWTDIKAGEGEMTRSGGQAGLEGRRWQQLITGWSVRLWLSGVQNTSRLLRDQLLKVYSGNVWFCVCACVCPPTGIKQKMLWKIINIYTSCQNPLITLSPSKCFQSSLEPRIMRDQSNFQLKRMKFKNSYLHFQRRPLKRIDVQNKHSGGSESVRQPRWSGNNKGPNWVSQSDICSINN